MTRDVIDRDNVWTSYFFANASNWKVENPNGCEIARRVDEEADDDTRKSIYIAVYIVVVVFFLITHVCLIFVFIFPLE